MLRKMFYMDGYLLAEATRTPTCAFARQTSILGYGG
jgi:hypothetical protein